MWPWAIHLAVFEDCPTPQPPQTRGVRMVVSELGKRLSWAAECSACVVLHPSESRPQGFSLLGSEMGLSTSEGPGGGTQPPYYLVF